MLLKTLKGRHVLLLMSVPFILLAFWFRNFLHTESLTGEMTQMPLYHMLQYMCGESGLALNIVGYVFLVIIALMLVRLNEKYIFIRQRTDLPAFVFSMMATGCLALHGMHPSLLAAFFLLFAVERVFGLYNGSGTLPKSFDAGLLIGMAAISYVYAGGFIIWFWVSLAILGYFRIREIMAGFMGFLLPVFVAVSWYYWNDSLPVFLKTIQVLFQYKQSVDYASIQLIYWGVVAFLVFVASLFMGNVSEEKKISSRKYFIILFVFFLLCAISFLSFSGAGIELYFIGLIPLTYILSHYFVLQKHSWIGEVLFGVFVAASILIHLLS